MFKLSIVETRAQRRLILEGRLVSPWTEEVEEAWAKAGEGLGERERVIDLTNVTLIGVDGEQTLSRLMERGAKFSCGGVFTRHLLRQVARKCGFRRLHRKNAGEEQKTCE